MLGRILGAVIGSKIDRRDGQGGMKGAIIGATVPGLLRRMGPLGIVLGGAWLIKQKVDANKAARSDRAV